MNTFIDGVKSITDYVQKRLLRSLARVQQYGSAANIQ